MKVVLSTFLSDIIDEEVDNMKNIPIRDLESSRLIIKRPTMEEQFSLWSILKDEKVNRYYFPTPDRIFAKNGLKNDNIDDMKRARSIFLEQLNDWERQEPFYEKKITAIQNGENSQKFTWSIFLKTGEVIGQITVQPNSEYPENPEIRDIGWFIKPIHQGKGYGTEAAKEVLDYMFNEVEIDKIITSAAIINEGSWKLMEKLGFERIGEKQSTYYDEEDNILMSYCYIGDKEKFLNKNNKVYKK